MKAYHFAALTALMGLAFLSGGLAAALVRQRVESWYGNFSRPEKLPPLPAHGWGWRCIYVLLGAGAWLAWLSGPQWGAPWVKLGMILYFALLGLSVLCAALFFRVARPGAALGAIVVQCLVTLAVLVVFGNIWILPAALLAPVLAWTGFVAIRNLLWWRHGRQLGPLEPEPAVPSA